MKNNLIFSIGVLLAVSMLTGCSGGSNTEKERQDSIRRADSIAALEAAMEQARLEAIQNDSILKEKAIELYAHAITIEPGNKDKRHVPESSFYKIDWECTVKNNTNIRFSAADYQVTYDETYEDGNADGLYDVTKQRTIKGVELQPDSTAQVVLTGRSNTQDLSKPAIKMVISEEDFINKYINANR